jgi:hypothetical protein
VTSRKLALSPLWGATMMALLAAPTAAAVAGSSGAPAYGPTYDPYPCAVVDSDPLCAYYDPYDPGAVFDQPNWGIGGGFGGIAGGGVGGIGGIGLR